MNQTLRGFKIQESAHESKEVLSNLTNQLALTAIDKQFTASNEGTH